MKAGSLFLSCMVAGLLLTGPALASTPTSSFTSEKLSVIEDNLLLGLASEIPGVRASAALTLKQVKAVAPDYSFARSVIPLMRIVNSEDLDINSRIAAALALHSLESDRGDYAIRMTAQLTDESRVKFIYEHLAYARLVEHLPAR